MPTYDYRCERTGEMFELWQSFSDDAITICPEIHKGEKAECGAPVKKVFSKVGISFKGEGFYKNDHGRKSPGAAAESGKSSTDSSSASESSSSSTSSDSSSTSSADSSSSSSKGSGNKGSGNKGSGNKGSGSSASG